MKVSLILIGLLLLPHLSKADELDPCQKGKAYALFEGSANGDEIHKIAKENGGIKLSRKSGSVSAIFPTGKQAQAFVNEVNNRDLGRGDCHRLNPLRKKTFHETPNADHSAIAI